MMAALEYPETIGEVLENEPMSRHTSWRVGGPAETFFRPASIDDLSGFLRNLDADVPVFWFGLGSNLLVRDGGLPGVVVATAGIFTVLEQSGDHLVRVGASVPCTQLARQCIRWGFGPSEFFAGIPGTLGGALAMNAGAHGSETWERVRAVTTIDRRGDVHERTPDDYDIDGQRIFRIDNEAQGMSYGAIAARAIQLGGEFSGETFPEDINEITQRSVRNLAGSGLIGVAKDNLPQDGVIPGLAVAFCEIELDLETGKYEILDYVGIAECGTVVHPKGLAQQMKGGAVWGMGMAGLERHVYDPQNGLPANVGYHQCRIPTYLDVPPVMHTGAVDLPDPQNPFGARGIGEPAMGCSVAALQSAISDALDGHIFGRSPVSPDMIVNYVAGREQSYLPLQTNNF